MRKRHRFGVEEIAEIARNGATIGCWHTSLRVQGIAPQRVTCGGGMNSDLMRSSCDRLHSQQRRLFPPFENLESGARGLSL